MVRVEGKKGNLVLFNDRDFHGSEQPVAVGCTTLIFNYYKLNAFGGKVKVVIPALLSGLDHYNQNNLYTADYFFRRQKSCL